MAVDLDQWLTELGARSEGGIYHLGAVNPGPAEALYTGVRRAEGRRYEDEAVAALPRVGRGHPLAGEWRSRAASAHSLVRYLAALDRELHLLDLGCGNGWLSNLITTAGRTTVVAVDVGLDELAQGARVFAHNPDLRFVRADVFAPELPVAAFDVVVVASAVQYFEDLPTLVSRLLELLSPDGELHLLDSPLYEARQVQAARERSRTYYTELGFPDMHRHYHHHCIDALKGYGFARLDRRLWPIRPRRQFPWLRLTPARARG